MTENNFTPPPELMQQWVAEIWHEGTPVQVALSDEHIATRAAQWGADCELDACCAWLLEEPLCASNTHKKLRAARRKAPSLKEQALETLQKLSKDGFPCNYQEDSDWDTIRRALEALPDG